MGTNIKKCVHNYDTNYYFLIFEEQICKVFSFKKKETTTVFWFCLSFLKHIAN